MYFSVSAAVQLERVARAEDDAADPKQGTAVANKLVDEGLIEKRRGLGMFVAVGAHDRLVKERRDTYLERVFRPAVEQADLLGIPRSELGACLDEHPETLPAPRVAEGETR